MANRTRSAILMIVVSAAAMLSSCRSAASSAMTGDGAAHQQPNTFSNDVGVFSQDASPFADFRPYYLVNRHPTRVVHGYRTNSSGTWTEWYRLPSPIPRTCQEADPEKCREKQLWRVLFQIECDKKTDIQIALLDTDGTWHAATATDVVTDCKYAYGWGTYPRDLP